MILQKINQSHIRYQLIPKYEEIIEMTLMESFKILEIILKFIIEKSSKVIVIGMN